MTDESLAAQIQLRAYEIWLSEGCPPERDRIHWVRAEAEFRERLTAQSYSCRTGLHEKPASVRFGRLPGRERRLNSS